MHCLIVGIMVLLGLIALCALFIGWAYFTCNISKGKWWGLALFMAPLLIAVSWLIAEVICK